MSSVMKLYAGRQADYDDLVALWPLSDFASPEQAVDQMYRAFPAAPEDPHLVEYVSAIADESAARSQN